MKTPLYAGALRRSVNSSLCGGYKSGRPKFIPVYMIYAALGNSVYYFEAKNMQFGHNLILNVNNG
jgi:hypothetical protein